MRKIKWIGILVMVLSITLSACTSVPEDKPKEPETTDISSSVFPRMVLVNGEAYSNGVSFILSGSAINDIGDLVQLESWIPIFKPIYHYTIGFTLLDANQNKFGFGLYDNKLLVVANINSKDYFFEASKSIYAPIKAIVDEVYQAHVVLPKYRDSGLVTAMARNNPVYYGWVNLKLSGQIDTAVLEGSLKRSAWMTNDVSSRATGDYAFVLTDSEGLIYRFFSIVAAPDQVEIYADPFGQEAPLAIYMVPDGVIENARALLEPLIVTTPAEDSITHAVFVKAYLDMWFFFESKNMLSDYGYPFTSDQKTTFNAIDRSTWLKLSSPSAEEANIFALIDSKGNQYFFSVHTYGALIKMVPKAKPSQPEYYVAPGMDTYKLYEDLLAANPIKGVLPIVKTVTFNSIFERGESTEYQKITDLTPTQSNQLIAILDYSSWTQKIGFQAGGWWFQFKATTTSGLDYLFGFDYAIVTLPDGSERFYNLTPEVMTKITDFFNSLK